jgi:hypothetical protein
LFSYTLTLGSETKTSELRKSNPQGWLLEAVRETFPDVASRRASDVIRLRLEAVQGARQTWTCTLPNEPELTIRVTQIKA